MASIHNTRFVFHVSAALLWLLGIHGLSAQGVHISGPTLVTATTTHTYYLEDPYGDVQPDTILWNADGILQSQDFNVFHVSVYWYQTGTVRIYASFQDYFYNYRNVELYVNVVSVSAPDTPSAPTVQSHLCGSTVLARVTPPSGVTWYWQDTALGTSTSNSSATVTRTTNGTQYLRARNNATGNWSTSSSSLAYTVQQPTVWYGDADGDGFGDPAVTVSACGQPAGYVGNADDNCPGVYALTNNGCGPVCATDVGNRIVSRSYNVDGTLTGHSRSYFNTLGKPVQVQGLDILTGRVWASQTLYDRHGRPAVRTLGAPVNADGCLVYAPGFVRNVSGASYGSADFETSPESPAAVGAQANTLGHYYSTGNTGEPYQDVTAHPFSRTVYGKLSPGAVKKVVGGNKAVVDGTEQWAQGHSFAMPVAQELHYAFGTAHYPTVKVAGGDCTFVPSPGPVTANTYSIVEMDIETCTTVGPTIYGVVLDQGNIELVRDGIYKMDYYGNGPGAIGKYYRVEDKSYGIDPNEVEGQIGVYCGPFADCSDIEVLADHVQATKTVVRDVNGVESVVFADSDGNTLAAARSGNEDGRAPAPYTVVSPIGAQGFVDIHIPVGCGGTVDFLGNGAARYDIYDLVTEARIQSGAHGQATLAPGLYRVAETTVFHLANRFPYARIRNGSVGLVGGTENIGVRYKVNYYDYSLNFYDRAGRLVRSVQPAGFDPALNLTAATRNHGLSSTFSYNSIGQLLTASSPDEGTASFKYRRDGQIRFSQNVLQSGKSEFSYTDYDAQGRPVESGVLASGGFASADPDAAALPAGTKREQVVTVYDEPDTTGLHAALSAAGIATAQYPSQKFVAGNVGKTYTLAPATATSWYSYDVYGRVSWLVQKIEGLGTKTIDYAYDPVTGAVTAVDYQRHVAGERFVHRYTYNVAGQLTRVETSTDNTAYTLQAAYSYYESGALKRTELAGDLQGIDYVYNLEGQLKAINSPQGSGFKDPGNDGPSTNGFKPDVFGMVIDYHGRDYARTGTPYNGLNNTGSTGRPDGNIGSVRWHNSTAAPGSSNIDTYRYRYNKNNWLSGADFGTSNASSAVSFAQNANNDYRVDNITYDANGNIKTLKRNKQTQGGNAMDDLTYTYDGTKKNRLVRVDDAVGPVAGADDIEDQSGINYVYDAIGRLAENVSEGLKYTYNTGGLVTEIKKNNVTLVRFSYDDRGHRVGKEIYTGGSLTRSDRYVRDASGSVLAVYEGTALKEHALYGLGRLGAYYRAGGTYAYQLADHLGNVRAVVMKDGAGALAVTNRTDYYPGGMAMPGRSIIGDYRYDYQGQEKDRETGLNAFELRMYDPRINRWLTSDPKKEFASPYLAMGNNWVNKIDPDGGSTASLDNDYTLHKDGTLTVKYTDDKFDRLFVEGQQGFDLINNQSILSSLFNTQSSGVGMAMVGAESKGDLFKVFKTAAKNSSPEWRMIRTTKNKYVMGTKYDSGWSPSSTDLGLAGDHEIFASIHSHPGNDMPTMISEMQSMGYYFGNKTIYEPTRVAQNDWQQHFDNVLSGKPVPRSYVYFPNSGRLFKITFKGPAPQYIRNINNNHGRFFFGVF